MGVKKKAPTLLDWGESLAVAGRALALARRSEELAKREGTFLAAQAVAAGMSERTAADLLGINRTSLRAWLRKKEESQEWQPDDAS